MQTYMSLVPFVLLATTKPVKILVTELLIYNRNYLENGIHLRLLRTRNTALEFIMKFRNLNSPKPFLTNLNTFIFSRWRSSSMRMKTEKPISYWSLSARELGWNRLSVRSPNISSKERRMWEAHTISLFLKEFFFHSLKQRITSVKCLFSSL